MFTERKHSKEEAKEMQGNVPMTRGVARARGLLEETARAVHDRKEVPAIRMLGPLSSRHPWRRPLYFVRGGDGSRVRRPTVFQASSVRPCNSACVLCGTGFVPPVLPFAP